MDKHQGYRKRHRSLLADREVERRAAVKGERPKAWSEVWQLWLETDEPYEEKELKPHAPLELAAMLDTALFHRLSGISEVAEALRKQGNLRPFAEARAERILARMG